MRRALAIGALLVGCTDVYLKEPPPPPRDTAHTTVDVSGSFCTDDPRTMVTPVKVLFALDYSQSMLVSDPGTTRGEAVVQVMERLGVSEALSYAVLLFRGDVNVLTKVTENGEQRDGFQPSTELDLNELRTRLAVGLDAPETVDQQTTDFIGALSRTRSLIEDDILRERGAPDLLERTRYVVIFLSDGIPTRNYPPGCQPGGTGRDACPVCVDEIEDEVQKIARLADMGIGGLTLNTAYVFANPDVPSPPTDVRRAASGLLSCMATAGAGDFRDFSLGEPVDFLGFDFATLQRTLVPRELVVSNRQARPGTFAPDTDGDGLSDEDEVTLGFDPLLDDADGDGYGDLLESRFLGNFQPTAVDPGCPPFERGDRDGDGLRDCEERFVGTALGIYDTDRDGVPDGLEWRMGTRGSTSDLDDDTDGDGRPNADELRAHTDPQVRDADELSLRAQRTTLVSRGPVVDGRACFDFRVEGIRLAKTLDGRPNEIEIVLAQSPLDASRPEPRHRIATLHATLRGEVREPADGKLVLPEALLLTPLPTPAPEVP